jgi:hypothetical protein
MHNIINLNTNLFQFQYFFFHIYSKNIKLYTKFLNHSDLETSLNFILKHFLSLNTSWKNTAKINFVIKFIPNNLSSFNSIY